jgi:hypothetical protein
VYGTLQNTGLYPKAGTVWADIGWDGDTQPLGSSVYQYDLLGRLNSGYSQPTYTDTAGKPQPQGGYVEVRPVSTPGSELDVVTSAQMAQLFQQMVAAGVIQITHGGAL